MRFTSSTSAALVASLLVNDVLAGVYHRHQNLHDARALLELTETITITDYVTVVWPPVSTTSSSSSVAKVETTPVSSPPPAATVIPAVAAAAVPSPKPTTLVKVVATTPAAAAPVVAAAASPSPSAAASVAVSSSSGSKRGAAYNNAGLVNAFSGSKVSWGYNWGQTSDGLNGQFEYVPMLWGLGDHVNGWTANANSAIASGSTHLLSFNEPDLDEQSNIGVGTAVAGYKQYVQPFAGRAKLGSPAVTNGAAPMGLAYLSSFIAACTGCTIDFVAIHWYDSASNFEYFKQHVTNAHTAGGGRPVWITEFGAAGSDAQQVAFLQQAIPWLESQSFVERYAYFMVSDGRLISGNGLSSIGQTFASA